VPNPTLEVPDDGELLIAVVADTHSKPHPDTEAQLRARAPDLILHAGDIGELGVITALGRIAPTVAVRGNIDTPTPEIPEDVCVDFRRGSELAFRVFMTHIAVNGPKLRADVRRRAQAAGAQLVVCGHSHVPFIARDGDMTVFNPGSVGPRRFQLPICFGVISLAKGRVSMEHIDCETGQRWLPPGIQRH